LAAGRALKRGGRQRSSLTRTHRPMSVAMEQCCTVGVNSTRTCRSASSTVICASVTYECTPG
jgi:hypothetical protein